MTNLARAVEVGLVSRGDAHQIMGRLVRLAAENLDVDRCTLTSLDQHVLRVEASYERGGEPDFVGHEYEMAWLERQPLLLQAVTTGSIVTGGSFDPDADPALRPALAEVRHTAIVPLSVGETVGAVFILSRKTDRPFAPVELESLQQTGMLAVLALRNARLVDDLRTSQDRGLDSLTLMSGHIASSMEPAAFFEKMSETVAVLAQAGHAAFWQLAGDGLVAMHQPPGKGVQSPVMRLEAPLPGSAEGLSRVMYAGEALRLSEREAADDPHLGAVLMSMHATDVLAVPWRTAAVPLGILTAWNSASGFTDQDEWIMRLAARASALVWQGYEAEHRAAELQAAELDRLEAHATRMAELERQKSEFLQLASHELRAPMTLVSGYLSMLEEGSLGVLPEQAARVVPLMTARMRHMGQLVDRMLTTSRMELRAGNRHIRDVDLDALARAAVDTAASTAQGAYRRLAVGSTGHLHVRADPEQVETILSNLVSNAVKYSPEGSEIRIEIREEPGWAIIDVIDQGFGIADEDLPKLFQPFGRLQSAVSAGIEGTGLGLHLSRSLAAANGGNIEVTSRRDEGSTFTLRLPLRGTGQAGRVDA
jgi:signal transduction histidine kinase